MRLPGSKSPQRIGGRAVPFARSVLLVQLGVALIILVYVAVNQQIKVPFTSDNFTIKADFADASGLNPGNRPAVMVAGVVLGHVKKVQEQDGHAVATLELSGKARNKIHADASARITPRSAINDLTVDVDPGTRSSPVLGSDGTIGIASTSAPVGLDEVLGVLNADTRAYVKVLLAQAATTLDGRDVQVRQTLGELSQLMDPTAGVAGALADRRHQLIRLVGNMDKVFTTLGERGRQLRGVVRDGESTLAVSARRQDDLAATMRVLPGTLTSVRDGLQGVTDLARPLVPALAELRPFATKLPAALASVRRVTPQATGLVGDVARLGSEGRAPTKSLTGLMRELGPASKRLLPPVQDLDPIVTSINDYKTGFAPLGDHFSGVFSTNDANGPRLRAYGFFEPINPTDLGFDVTTAASKRAMQRDVVRALTRVCKASNPLACLIPYLVPGLSQAVGRVTDLAANASKTLSAELSRHVGEIDLKSVQQLRDRIHLLGRR